MIRLQRVALYTFVLIHSISLIGGLIG